MKEAIRIITSVVITVGIMAGLVLGPYCLGTLVWGASGITKAPNALDLWFAGLIVSTFGVAGILVALGVIGLIIVFFCGCGRQVYIGLGGTP